MARDRGQNFLVDQRYISKIFECAQLKSEDEVIEIGPGYGALTIPMCKMVSGIVAIEWDKRLVEFLNTHLPDGGAHIEVIQADALEVDFLKIVRGFSHPPVIMGNLPYYIATPLIRKLLPLRCFVARMVFMVQKEVADRIIAPPGTKAYGYLSLVIQYFTRAERVLDIPPSVFKPKPKVDSSVVVLRPLPCPPVEAEDEDALFRVIKSAFRHRRKTLVNSLKLDPLFKQIAIEEVCENVHIKQDVRAEMLTLGDFACLSKAFPFLRPSPICHSSKQGI